MDYVGYLVPNENLNDKNKLCIKVSNIIKEICSEHEKNGDCGSEICTNCTLTYLDKLNENITFKKQITRGDLEHFLTTFPNKDTRVYDESKLASLFSLFLATCNNCLDHEYNYKSCSTSTGLALLETMITKKLDKESINSQMKNEKHIFSRVQRISEYNSDIRKQIILDFKENLRANLFTKIK